MATRREKRGEGFYAKLNSFSTADEWQALAGRKRKATRARGDVYEVEYILRERKRRGTREFLVKWQGWGSEFNSWEPEAHFLNPAIIRNFEHPGLEVEEVMRLSEVLLNLFEAGLHQDLASRFIIDFSIKDFNFFFSGKGEQRQRGTTALYKEDFSLCNFPFGWDRARVNERGTQRELLFPILLRPFLSRSTQLYNADGSKRQRRWIQRVSISFRKHTI